MNMGVAIKIIFLSNISYFTNSNNVWDIKFDLLVKISEFGF